MPSLATFNANNFFLRYKFANTYPGDKSKKSAIEAGAAVTLGYFPGRAFDTYPKSRYVVWDPTRRDLAAQLLAEPDNRLPDMLCLQEVENLHAIRVLNERHFGGHYPYQLLIDSYDERNIDVALFSRFPIGDVRTHVDDKRGGKRLFSRDCLEATVLLPGGEPLVLLINHFKSKYSESTAELRRGHELRLAQAREVAAIVKRRFKGQYGTALYAVIGDFNDTPESPWMKPLEDSPHLIDCIARHVPADERWTYYWRAKYKVSQIDRILVSRALAARIKAAVDVNANRRPYIARAGLGYFKINPAGEVLPREVTFVRFEADAATPAPASFTPSTKVPFQFERFEDVLDDLSANTSDHCPVKVWF